MRGPEPLRYSGTPRTRQNPLTSDIFGQCVVPVLYVAKWHSRFLTGSQSIILTLISEFGLQFQNSDFQLPSSPLSYDLDDSAKMSWEIHLYFRYVKINWITAIAESNNRYSYMLHLSNHTIYPLLSTVCLRSLACDAPIDKHAHAHAHARTHTHNYNSLVFHMVEWPGGVLLKCVQP